MTTSPRVRLQIEGNRLVDDRTDAVADIAAQAEEIQAGFVVDQHRHTHLGLVDVGQLMVQCLGRAGLDAGNVVAHLARNVARIEVGRAGRHRVFRLGQFQGVIGTVTNAQAATDTCTEEILFGQGTGRAQGEGRQGLRLLGIKTQTQAQHADTTRHAGGIEHELAAGCACFWGVAFH